MKLVGTLEKVVLIMFQAREPTEDIRLRVEIFRSSSQHDLHGAYFSQVFRLDYFALEPKKFEGVELEENSAADHDLYVLDPLFSDTVLSAENSDDAMKEMLEIIRQRLSA